MPHVIEKIRRKETDKNFEKQTLLKNVTKK